MATKESSESSQPEPKGRSPLLFLVMLGVIVASIVVFILMGPLKGGGGSGSGSKSTSSSGNK